MEIMLNGQLVSCTPKEYKELMEMGLISSPYSGASQSIKTMPGNIPILPDDINPLPETTGNPPPSQFATKSDNTSLKSDYRKLIDTMEKANSK